MNKLDDFVSFLSDTPIIRKINVLGGMGGVYEEEKDEFQEVDNSIEDLGVDVN